jgi:4-diphosphocytidyl-2-C-methyl-D-erythritol kinase
MFDTRRRSIDLIAPAKINLALEVTSRRPDGYHNLVTIFQSLELHDTLSISLADSMRVSCEHPGITDRDNLAWTAADLLSERIGDSSLGAHIVVQKRIPISGGLGGGSSDAAAALVGLSHLWQRSNKNSSLKDEPIGGGPGEDQIFGSAEGNGKHLDDCPSSAGDLPQRQGIPDMDLAGLAYRLGADVAYFLLGGTVLGTGRGDVLRALRPLPRRGVVLIEPQIEIVDRKTPRMFRSLRAEDFGDGARTQAAVSEIESGRWPTEDLLINAFDRAADDVFSGLRAVRDTVENVTGLPVRLTGSGPTLFVLVDDPDQVAEQLRSAGLVATPTFASAQRAGIRPTA